MTTRRGFLLGAGAMMATGPAAAAGYCSPFDYSGIQACEVGLEMGPVVTAQQKCQNWCWAACIETIFALRGYRVPQQAIVEKVYGSPDACRTATSAQIVQAVDGNWRTTDGRRFTARPEVLTDLQMGYMRPDTLGQVWNDLSAGRPLINGAVGHATLLTAMQYLRDVYGRTQITGLTVRDPWPFSPNRRMLAPHEVNGTIFICRVMVS